MQIVRDITTTVAPTAEVVTLTEAKNYLRVDYNEDDTLIQSLIDTAQTRLEQYASVAMTERKLAVYAYVSEFIELPYYPIGTIERVQYWDGNNWVTMVYGDYIVAGITTKKVYMVANNNMEYNFIYTCGYSTTPKTMKTAILKYVADLYEYRESSVEDTQPNANITTAYELMKPYKRINYIL